MEKYKISDLAKEFDITTRSIRFYEDVGLIEPERKGNMRIYQRRDKIRLKLILRGNGSASRWQKYVNCSNFTTCNKRMNSCSKCLISLKKSKPCYNSS